MPDGLLQGRRAPMPGAEMGIAAATARALAEAGAEGAVLSNGETVRRRPARGTQGAMVSTAALVARIGAPLLAHDAEGEFAVVGLNHRRLIRPAFPPAPPPFPP